MQVRVATAADEAAVRRFNERLAAGGVRYRLPPPACAPLPGEFRHRAGGLPVYRELIVATDGDEVRAGTLLYHASAWVGGAERAFAWVQLPLSEALVDARYAMAMVLVLRWVLAREPFLMSLGIGSRAEAWARLLDRAGWQSAAVPFVFHPVRVGRLLTGLPRVTKSRWGAAARVAVALGAGALAGTPLALARARAAWRTRGYEAAVEPSFAPWADAIWRGARGDYGATVAKDAAALDVRFPPDDPRYTRLRVRRRADGADVGWVVAVDARMAEDSYFGDLHVGTLVDGFARPADVPALVHAALAHLTTRGVDLVVGNVSHRAWRLACRAAGFVDGPSNFFLYVSPAGAPLLSDACPLEAVHVTRGDNDGPGRLLPRRPATPRGDRMG